MTKQKQCALCGSQEEEFRIVEKTTHAFVLVPTGALKQGHIMILPKAHREAFNECTQQEAKEMFDLIEKYKHKLKEKTNQDPLTMINSFSHSSQDHIHIHLVPSKNTMRVLISNSEQIPARPNRSQQDLAKMKETIV